MAGTSILMRLTLGDSANKKKWQNLVHHEALPETAHGSLHQPAVAYPENQTDKAADRQPGFQPTASELQQTQ